MTVRYRAIINEKQLTKKMMGKRVLSCVLTVIVTILFLVMRLDCMNVIIPVEVMNGKMDGMTVEVARPVEAVVPLREEVQPAVLLKQVAIKRQLHR
jgi:hypothetical protein